MEPAMNNALKALEEIEKPVEAPKEDPKPEEPKEPGKEESPKEDPTKEEPKEVPKEVISSKFAALAKKEKVIVSRQQQLSERERTIEEREKAVVAKEGEYQDWLKKKESARLNPEEWLREGGMTYEEATQYFLNNKSPTADTRVQLLETRLERMQREQVDREKKAQEDQKKANEAALHGKWTQFQTDLRDFLDTNEEKYPLINKAGYQDQVYFTIIEAANTYKRTLTFQEAADLTEDFLKGRLKEIYEDPKTSTYFKAQQVVKEEKKVEAKPTLTNSMTASSLPALTEQDRIARAMAALDAV